MEMKEIIMEALHFPINNIQSLALYIVLGIILAIIAIITGVTGAASVAATSGSGVAISLIGILLCLVIYFAINGYELDIVKSGIERSSDAPSIDFVRQFLNGVKLFVVQLIYFIIPIILVLIFSLIFSRWITILIACILFILFAFVETMGECRLAKTDDLNYALQISEAYDDIKRIGVTKVVCTIVLVGIIFAVIYFIVDGIFGFINQDLASIVTSIVSVYLLFFENRATGLLYSDLY